MREASRRFDIPKSTTQRIMNTLLEAEMVEFNERTQSYSLGNGILKFMSPYVNKNSLIALAKADMDKLRDELGETIGLHSQVDGMQILAHQSESNRELKWSLEVGKMYPLNSGASGKTLLAYMSEKQFEKAKSRFAKVTDKTPDEEKLLEELEKIRKLGYSVSRGEFLPWGNGDRGSDFQRR